MSSMGNGCARQLRDAVERLASGRRTLIVVDCSESVPDASKVFAFEGDQLVEVP